jgi:hypothetical protein
LFLTESEGKWNTDDLIHHCAELDPGDEILEQIAKVADEEK